MSYPRDYLIENGVLKKYKGSGGDVVIPDGVTSIGGYAFFNCSSLTSVTIPTGVTSIWPYAFSGCSSLSSVTIPVGVTSIGDGAFHDCYSLTSVTIPEGVTSIGKSAFYNCRGLTSVTIPVGVTEIGSEAFSGCYSLTSLTIPNGVTSIGNNAFDCSVLHSDSEGFVILGSVLYSYHGPGGDMVIPESVTSIGDNAFNRCNSLTSVTIPVGVTNIGGSAFSGCCNLTSVTVPESVTSIGDSAFKSCGSLMSLTIPTKVTSIGDCVFYGCRNLTSVMIPDSVTSIGGSAFYNCSSLRSVTIPASVTSIGNSAFYECHNLTSVTIPEGVTSIGDRAFAWCRNLTSMKIPAGVTRIGSRAFSECRSLTNVIIPGSVTNIGYNAFEGCNALERIELASTNVSFEDDPFLDCNKLCIYLPDGVVRTNQKLAVPLSRACGSLDEEDLAWVLLYQTAKSWKTEAISATKQKDIAKILQKQLELLASMKKIPSAAASNMLEFFMSLGQKAPAEQLKTFAALLQDKKCAKQLATLEADVTLREKLLGSEATENLSPAERKVKENLDKEERSQKVLADQFRDMTSRSIDELPSLTDAEGNICKPVVLAWLLTAHEKTKVSSGPYSGSTTEVVPAWTAPGLRPEAAEIVSLLNPDSLQKALIKLADENLGISGHSKKMFLAYPICRYADETTMAELCRRAPKWRSSVSGNEAPPLYTFRSAARYSNTRAAMLLAERYHELNKYAALRGTDADTLRDTLLADFGFDEFGRKYYDLGNGVLTASMAHNLTLSLYDDNAQKAVKSVPKKDADPEKYEAVKTDLALMRKNIKKVVKARNDLLLEAFLTGSKFKADHWAAVYLQNPVLNAVARLLVWEQEGNCFTLTDTGPMDTDGHTYNLTDAAISVAHPREMKPEEVTVWQKYFSAHDLKQPFAQVWEPVISPATVKLERYKGCMIPYYRFTGQEKHGIQIQDYQFHNEIVITMADCNVDVERIDWRDHDIRMEDRFEVTRFDFTKYTRKVNHIVAYLDRVTVWDRVRKDDVEVMNLVPGFTLAQITEFVKVAQEANAVNVLALLLEYKNAHFADFNPMDEFTLEW